jgi:hypothetical protein
MHDDMRLFRAMKFCYALTLRRNIQYDNEVKKNPVSIIILRIPG